MAERYKFGDYLVPMATDLATALPQLQRQGQQYLLEQAKLALDNRKEERFAEEAAEDREYRDKTFRQNTELQRQQQKFREDQAKRTEMNNMLRFAKTPAQQATILNKFGKPEMAAQVKAEGDKVEDQNTIVESYWTESLGSSPKDVVIAGKSALANIDLTHANYSSIAERTHKAYQESLNQYQDMLKDPRYKLQYDVLLSRAKMPNADIQGIFDQLDTMAERYEAQRYGQSEDEGDKSGKGKTIDEQADELVSSLLTGDAFTPEGALDFGPQTEADVTKLATTVESTSKINIGKLEGSVSKLNNRKRILDRTAKIRTLSETQMKELEKINATLKATKDELSKQRKYSKEAFRQKNPFYFSPTTTKLSTL